MVNSLMLDKLMVVHRSNFFLVLHYSEDTDFIQLAKQNHPRKFASLEIIFSSGLDIHKYSYMLA